MSYEVKISRDEDDCFYGRLALPRLRKYVIEIYNDGELLRRSRCFGTLFKRRLLRKLRRIVGVELYRAKAMAEACNISAL